MIKRVPMTSWALCKRELANVGALYDTEYMSVGSVPIVNGKFSPIDIGGPIRHELMTDAAGLLNTARRIIKNDHRDFLPTEALCMLKAAEALIEIARARRERGHRIAAAERREKLDMREIA